VGPRDRLGEVSDLVVCHQDRKALTWKSNLAWHEMRLLLATVILHFDIRLRRESEHWAEQEVYTLWQKRPLLCVLSEVSG